MVRPEARHPQKRKSRLAISSAGHPESCVLDAGDARRWVRLPHEHRIRRCGGHEPRSDQEFILASGMPRRLSKTAPRTRFEAKLLRPAAPAKTRSWTFLSPAQERQRETPHARHDDGWRHYQWRSLSSYARASEMLAAGKRRVCCFDRSGFHGKGFGAPGAADQDEIQLHVVAGAWQFIQADALRGSA